MITFPLIGEWSLGWLLMVSGALCLIATTLFYYWSEDGTLGEHYTLAIPSGLVILVGIFIEDWLVGQTLVGVGAIAVLAFWVRKHRRAR